MIRTLLADKSSVGLDLPAGLLAGIVERSTAQAPVVEVIRVIESSLQHPPLRNLPTQPIVTHIKILQVQLSHHLRDAPVDLVMVNVQRC